MTAPRITIITTNDPQASRLEETVRSVLDQGYSNLEYMVVDASDDGSGCGMLRKYERYLSWSISQETWNPARILNSAFTRATGTLLGHVPAGMRLEPGALQHIADVYARDASPWIVGWSREIDAEGRTQPSLVKPHARPVDWLLGNPLPDSSSFLAASLWRETGRFRETLKHAFKYEYWLRLRFIANVGPRIANECITSGFARTTILLPRDEKHLARELKRVRREYRRRLPWRAQLSMLNAARRQQAQALRSEAWKLQRTNKTQQAKKMAFSSLTRDALSIDAWQIAAGGSRRSGLTDRSTQQSAASREQVRVHQEKEMRVTVVCSMFPPALAPEAAHASLLCKHLAESSCDVTLITSDIPGISNEPLPYTLRATMKGWGWTDAPRLLRELSLSKPDVVLLIYLGWIYDRHPMATFLPTLCRRMKEPPRVITQFENSQGAELERPNEWRAWKTAALFAGRSGIEHRFGTLLRDSDEVIALCEPHLDDLTRHFAELPAKTTVIPAPPLLKIVDDASGEVRRKTRARLGYRDDDFVVAYFGYIYPEKGVETVIEAAGFALSDVPTIRLLMIGGVPGNLAERDPTYAQRVRDLAQSKGLSDRTFWTGHCEPEGDDASSYLHAADAVVLPFLQGVRLNNSSYSVVTCHGLPVITTRGENIEPEFRDRDNCMLFAPGDPKAAGQAIVDVATNPTLRATLQSGALTYSHGRASWSAVTRQTIEVMKESKSITQPRPNTAMTDSVSMSHSASTATATPALRAS